MNATSLQPLPQGANPPAPPVPAAPTARLGSLHLAVLTMFAVSQPLFDQLSSRPAFLADSGVRVPALLVLTATLALLIPAAVAGSVYLIGRVAPRVRYAAHAIAVFVLSVLILLPVVKRIIFLPPSLMIVLSLVLGASATWGYYAFRHLRAVVTVATPAIAVFPAAFLLLSPVSELFSAPAKIQVDRWNPVPVVMVVFDELRGTALLNDRQEIDGERFPNFAELARGSTWYRNATTVSPDTWVAVPALLSGKYLTSPQPPLPATLPQNLFSLVASTGAYDVAIFEPVSRLAGPAEVESSAKTCVLSQVQAVVPALTCVYLKHLTPVDLHGYLPEIPPRWFGLRDTTLISRTKHRGVFRYPWGEDRSGQFDHFLDCLEDTPRPGLHFLHLLLPHVPWCYLPSGRRYLPEAKDWHLLNFTTHGGVADVWGADELYMRQSQQRQILQLQYVDQLLGRLIARLKERELYDRCLLVITADHGISFRSNEPRRSVTAGNLVDIMPIPSFIKLPGQTAGAVSDRNVESIDILPTIADVLGIQLRLPVDGQSLLDTTAPERAEKKVLVEGKLTSVPASIVATSREQNDVLTRFGSGADRDAMYRFGPYSELVGQSIANLPIDKRQPVEIELLHSNTFYDSDPQALVPCYFEGRIVSPAGFELPVPIAVAINGTIRTVTRTYQLDGFRDRWTAMVPERALREGANDVQFLAISGEGPNLRFTRCVVKPAP